MGPEGTFTERALRTLPEAAHTPLLPAATAREALAHLRTGAARAAMLPVHNTVGGPVPDTLRALVDAPGVHARREVVLGIEFALLVRPGTRPGEVRTVTGHPHARAQVTGWLAAFLPRARWMSAPSNAAGARWVRDGRCDAAVAGEFTAARYGLAVAAAGSRAIPARSPGSSCWLPPRRRVGRRGAAAPTARRWPAGPTAPPRDAGGPGPSVRPPRSAEAAGRLRRDGRR
ncbi:prephenate dehydratase domain-containing protein [Streptomyces sp. CC210A]|uniref:prephenate dehydratase domain-containing protein n=1 Tax=Streptomyces sp. CC210A TaxID=2898184 RepID=UPI001F39338A|nr:prephenate dehydratase domain-containing protein [Streptomyces sp. CC210A]